MTVSGTFAMLSQREKVKALQFLHWNILINLVPERGDLWKILNSVFQMTILLTQQLSLTVNAKFFGDESGDSAVRGHFQKAPLTSGLQSRKCRDQQKASTASRVSSTLCPGWPGCCRTRCSPGSILIEEPQTAEAHLLEQG